LGLYKWNSRLISKEGTGKNVEVIDGDHVRYPVSGRDFNAQSSEHDARVLTHYKAKTALVLFMGTRYIIARHQEDE
jgi:hypothetical protein